MGNLFQIFLAAGLFLINPECLCLLHNCLNLLVGKTLFLLFQFVCQSLLLLSGKSLHRLYHQYNLMCVLQNCFLYQFLKIAGIHIFL